MVREKVDQRLTAFMKIVCIRKLSRAHQIIILCTRELSHKIIILIAQGIILCAQNNNFDHKKDHFLGLFEFNAKVEVKLQPWDTAHWSKR